MPSEELAGQAEFAARFKNTTNLAQRRRYQDTLEEADMEDRRDAQDQYDWQLGRAALKDPLKAENLRVARQRERRMGDEFVAREDRFIRQEDAAAERFRLKTQTDEQKLKLDRMKVNIAQKKALREMQDAERVLKHTDAVESADFELRSNGLLPGSEGYAAGVMSAVIANPYASPELRKAVLAQAKVDVDPEELMHRASGAMERPKLSMTVGPDGRTSYRISDAPAPRALKEEKPPDLHAQLKDMTTEYRALINDFNREQDPAMKSHFEARIKDLRGKMTGLNSQSSTAATPAVESTPAPSARNPDRLKELFGGQ